MSRPSPDPAKLDAFRVPPWQDRVGGFVVRHPRLMRRLGDFETRMLADHLAGAEVRAPIFIAGLARSGSTILLETLARHPALATHRYRDFPGLFTPVLWSGLYDRSVRSDGAAVERAHADGIMVTPESPEALEEMIWMAFFPNAHDPSVSNRLEAGDRQERFDAFYRDHVRKLLHLRGRERYLAKGNYNLVRLGYLQSLFPDARFIVPVRDPVWHTASLIKQHALFRAAEERHPAALRHMQRVGHFEFGLDRRPINTGTGSWLPEVQRSWAEGREVEGTARYWAGLHSFVADRLASDVALREATLIVRYEELCAAPAATVGRLLDHCGLAADDDWLATAVAGIQAPTYYRPRFTPDELSLIERETAATARRFGYGSGHDDRARRDGTGAAAA